MEEPMRLRWYKLSPRIAQMSVKGGSATVVGGKVYITSGSGHLMVFHYRKRILKALGWKMLFIDPWHVAQLAGDKIYYFGGKNTRALVEYDTVLNTSRDVETATTGPIRREYMSAVYAWWRKEILSFGGFYPGTYNRSNETHAFHVVSKSWKLLKLAGQPPEPRTVHAATIYGTKMYIYGGCTEGNRYLDDLWIAELANGVTAFWSQPQINGFIPARRTQSRLNNLNGLLVVFGGNDSLRNAVGEVLIYDPVAKVWHERSTSPLVIMDVSPIEVKGPLGVTTADGIIYVTIFGIYLLSRDS